MTGIVRFLINHRLAVLAIICVVSVFLGWRALQLREDLSFETLYLANSPEISFSDKFAETFENVNDMIAIAITTDNPDPDTAMFAPEFLSAMRRIVQCIETMKYVRTVYSLVNARYIEATEEGIDVGEFITDIPTNIVEAKKLAVKARQYPLYRGRLISDDGRYVGIMVQMMDMVGAPADSELASLLDELSAGKQDRDALASRLWHMRYRLLSVMEGKNSRYKKALEQLASEKKEEKDSAIQLLASAGSRLVRRLGVEDRRRVIHEIEELVARELPHGYKAFITGMNVVERDYARILKRDKQIFHAVTIIVLVISMQIIFQRLLYTVIAGIALGFSAACSMGIIQLLGGCIDIINSVLFIMILVVGTSTVIHMIVEFKNQITRYQNTPVSAVIDMVDRVGSSCFMAAATTACGFGSLYFAKIKTISQFGLNMAVAIFTTFAVSFIILVLLLSYVVSVKPVSSSPGKKTLSEYIALKAGELVISKWQLLLVLWAIVIVISAIGMRSLYVETHAVCEVSEKSPTMIKIRAQEHLNGFLGLEISIRSLTDKPVIAPEILAKADKMVEYLRNRPETLRAWALTDYMKVMNKAAHEGQEEFYRLPDSVEAVDQFILLYTFTPAGRREINGLISEDRKWLRIVGRVKDVGASKYLKLCADLNELASKLFSGSEVEVRVTSESYLLHVAMNNILRDVLNSVMWAFIFIGILVGISLRSLRYGLVAIMPNLIPLFTTLGMMGYSGIALRVGTAVVFSVGLGIAVDNTIHCLEEYRRFKERGLSYSEAILKIYQTATPRMIYASVVLILGFLGISFATFKSVWQMGVLCSFLIAIALSADMLLTLLLVRFTELPVFSEMRGNETRK